MCNASSQKQLQFLRFLYSFRGDIGGVKWSRYDDMGIWNVFLKFCSRTSNSLKFRQLKSWRDKHIYFPWYYSVDYSDTLFERNYYMVQDQVSTNFHITCNHNFQFTAWKRVNKMSNEIFLFHVTHNHIFQFTVRERVNDMSNEVYLLLHWCFFIFLHVSPHMSCAKFC